MGLTIGIDVGGTKVAAGVVDEQGQIIARTRRWTPSLSPDKTEDVIADVVRELTAMHVVDAVGLGAAGFIDLSRSTVLFAPNLAWRDEPLRSDVEGRIGLPVVVENDGNCAAWAEYRYGAGRGVDDLAVVCLGTGIGGGFVFHGKLYRGGFGIAGEFGHVNVVPGGHPCGCGNFGCWEQYASGNALVRKARQLASRDRLAARKLLSLGDASPDGITGVHVTQAARDGDPVALAAFDDIGAWLGQGLADIAAHLDPAMFVIGGGVSEAGELLLTPARDAYAAALTGAAYRPLAPIVRAELVNDAGVVGAADLARSAD